MHILYILSAYPVYSQLACDNRKIVVRLQHDNCSYVVSNTGVNLSYVCCYKKMKLYIDYRLTSK